MDAIHYFAGGVLCGASSPRLATYREGVTCPACLELLSPCSAHGPEPARVLGRYTEPSAEERSATGERARLPLRARSRGPRAAMLDWMERLLGPRRGRGTPCAAGEGPARRAS